MLGERNRQTRHGIRNPASNIQVGTRHEGSHFFGGLMSIGKFVLLTGMVAGSALLIRNFGSMGAPRHRAVRPSRSEVMDLNSAPAEDLRRLGLDDVAVGRIVENRPYRNKLELVSRMVIPEMLYGEIRHHVDVRETGESVKVA